MYGHVKACRKLASMARKKILERYGIIYICYKSLFNPGAPNSLCLFYVIRTRFMQKTQ